MYVHKIKGTHPQGRLNVPNNPQKPLYERETNALSHLISSEGLLTKVVLDMR